MPDSSRKAPFHCPHCGFVQNEPPHLISTYCRSCGSHYEVAAGKSLARKPMAGLLGSTVRQTAARVVHCHHCGRDQDVSFHAKSTICPGCNVSIELEDLIFSSPVSRPVNTRGKLIVEPGGSLNSTLIICGEALIEGRINGALICEGTLELACKARLTQSITATSIIISKDAHVEMVQPVKTTNLVIRGRASGNFECSGRVTISKRGVLEGRLVARSVVVEPGGSLLAESTIQPLKHAGPPTGSQSASLPEKSGPYGAGNPLPAY